MLITTHQSQKTLHQSYDNHTTDTVAPIAGAIWIAWFT